MLRAMPHYRYERKIDGPVAGIDEAGRGPWAGPVVAAAVILNPGKIPRGLNDSKQLTAEMREALFDKIMSSALAVKAVAVEVDDIDRLNIYWATMQAMRQSLEGLALAPVHALIDGNRSPKELPCSVQTIVDGDTISQSIAAASIIAKVTRDRLMCALAERYTDYGFERHKGYGTRVHAEALLRLGPCPEHRRSFEPVRVALEIQAGNASADLLQEFVAEAKVEA
jgi:ribonuclease HII